MWSFAAAKRIVQRCCQGLPLAKTPSESVAFDVAAYSGFHFDLLGSPLPLPLEGDFVGMFMVLLGLGGIDCYKILI